MMPPNVLASTLLAFATGVILCSIGGCEELTDAETCEPDVTYGRLCDNTIECYQSVDETDDFAAICATTCENEYVFSKARDCAACQPYKTVYGTNCFQVSPGSGFFDCESLSDVNPGGDVFTCTQKDCGASYNKIKDCTHKAALPQHNT